MGLYDNAWPHVYEEIRRCYPVWYRDVLEMDAIWRAQGIELDGARSTIEALINNNYIATADLDTITALEEFLRITPTTGQTLQERRQIITAYTKGQDHIGAPEIKAIVGTFTAGAVDVGFCAGIISVKAKCEGSENINLGDCLKILHARIPAHLRLAFTYELPPTVFSEPAGAFRLHSLLLSMSFSNMRNPVIRFNGEADFGGEITFAQTNDGIKMPLLRIRTSFAEPLRRQMILFDGEAKFNGENMFDQISSGLQLSALRLYSGFRAQRDAGLSRLRMCSHLSNVPKPVQCPELSLSFGFPQNPSGNLGGTVTIDNWCALDGSVAFDGSRRFDAQIKQEVL